MVLLNYFQLRHIKIFYTNILYNPLLNNQIITRYRRSTPHNQLFTLFTLCHTIYMSYQLQYTDELNSHRVC